MDELLADIEKALEAKGMSASAASKLAVGHPQMLKNLRNRRGGERTHPIDSLVKLAQVLGLKLTLTPIDAQGFASGIDWHGFAEDQIKIDGRKEALALGYEPIPFDGEAGGTENLSPFALSRDWIEGQGLRLSNLRCIRVLANQGGGFYAEGDLVVIDISERKVLNGDIFAFYPSALSGMQIGRLATIRALTVAVYDTDTGMRHAELERGSKIIGRVVYGFGKANHDD